MITGLVVHLSPDERAASAAYREIAAHPAIETGERNHLRLPLVAETTDVAGMHDLTDWLAARDGVTHVDVAFADVSDPTHTETEDATTPSIIMNP